MISREIPQPTEFLLDHGAKIVAEIESSHYQRSPLKQGGLEICWKVSATLPGTTKNHMLLDQYKELVNKLCCQPKNDVIIGNFLLSVPNENIHLNQPSNNSWLRRK